MEGAIRRVTVALSGAVAAAGAVAAVVLVAAPPSPSAKSSPKGYVIGQFNMAGGTTEHGAKGNPVPDDLAEGVADRRPAVLTLQETCRDWAERLEERLKGYGVVFAPVDNLARNPGTPARCHHPADFGNTLVFREDLGFEQESAESHLLGSTSGDEYREMVCVRSEERKLVACSAHLTPGEDEYAASREKEAAEAVRVLTGRYEGYRAVLGGDINDLPLSGVLDRFYHRGYGHGARGAFKEAAGPCGDAMKPRQPRDALPRNRYTHCRSGEPTHSKGKIDYLFVAPSVRVEWSGVSHSEQSDHKQVWARVVF
ncbi:Endonuclease/Exonuclease/phosphatase family protein [Streptomyces sp. WMMB 714]|jgi:endonuclease/exonuclease/phosphatase family metal-dependent hydrolase|nr:Endonuclease/Exonuclease/phosphatase family protein [Streptomyces sp. WMMB 714]